MSSHSIVRQGPGGTSDNAVKQIGTDITMPAGGPHNIYAIGTCSVLHTPTPNQSLQGILKITSLSGDITPDPAPGKFPCIGLGNASSANLGAALVPLNIFPVNFQAAGKSLLKLEYINSGTNSFPPEILAAIFFGDKPPEQSPLNFIDQVDKAFTTAAEVSLGSITISEKAKRLTGILAIGLHAGPITASQEVMGSVRLDSNDVQLQPAQYPFSLCSSAGLGTPAGQPSTPHLPFIPLDIPLPGGSIINIYATTSIAVTGSARVQVFLAYE